MTRPNARRLLKIPVKSNAYLCFIYFMLAASMWAQSANVGTPAGESLPAAPSSASVTDIEQARRLSQQGKNAEALARLQALAAGNPSLPGLSRELGLAYYRS